MYIRSCPLFIVLVLLLSCAGDEPASPGLRLRMKAFTRESMISGRKAHGMVTFQEARVGVTKVELTTPSVQDDPETEAEYEGAFWVDLLAGTSEPDFETVGLVPGNYDKIEVDLSPLVPGGKTLLVRFIHDQDQFELSTTQALDLELEGLSALGLANVATPLDLLVLLDLDLLFQDITFDGLTPGNDGVIRINDTSNAGLLADILDNLKDACEAGEDEDRDGEIDD